MALGSFFYDNALASWICDKTSLKFVEVNARCLSLYGYTKAEFLERLNVNDLVPKEDRRSLSRYLKMINTSVSPIRLPQRKKDGTGFQVFLYIKSVEFYGRDCAYVTAIESDEILFSKPLPHSHAINQGVFS